MSLTPLNGIIDLAVLNISRPIAPLPNRVPQAGTHFDRFWDLAQHPPASVDRSIPHLPRTRVATRDVESLQPATTTVPSALLNQIFVHGGRGPYDQILCPMSQYSPPYP
jgi:hypothetical protein